MKNKDPYEEAEKMFEVAYNINYLDHNGNPKSGKEYLREVFMCGYSCGYVEGGVKAWDRVSEIVKDNK